MYYTSTRPYPLQGERWRLREKAPDLEHHLT